jgi:hypothetical protein
MWSFGKYTLRLSENEFWGLTLAQFGALVERHAQAEERADLRIGILSSLLANIYRNPKKRSQPFEPQDFMLTRQSQKVPTQEQLERKLDGIFNIMGIEKVKKHG